MIDRDDIGAWVRLLATPGIGPDSARRLLAAFGSANAIFAASDTSLREVVGAAAATALGEQASEVEEQVARALAWLDEASPEVRSIVTLGDARYPPSLLETADPPLLLYTQGRCDLLHAKAIAVVGSRNPTRQGTENGRAFSSHLSQAGWTIVSGLALGIDAAAHTGGLDGPGSTIAVVGTGLDSIYPKQNRELAHRIAAEGLIVSEFPLGTSPRSENFQIRNRIIAGMSSGTLVVEAALQSGSLITARLALEAGRDVFAIPGSIHSPQARGCHALIKQGAKLVDRAEDVLEELTSSSGIADRSSKVLESSQTEIGARDVILEALGFDPASLDTLIARTGWAAAELQAHLLDLELAGRVVRLPGQLFQRMAHG